MDCDKWTVTDADSDCESLLAFICSITKDLTNQYNAGKLVKEVAAVTGGGGGGRPDMAQAGGKDISKVDEALNKIYKLI